MVGDSFVGRTHGIQYCEGDADCRCYKCEIKRLKVQLDAAHRERDQWQQSAERTQRFLATEQGICRGFREERDAAHRERDEMRDAVNIATTVVERYTKPPEFTAWEQGIIDKYGMPTFHPSDTPEMRHERICFQILDLSDVTR